MERINYEKDIRIDPDSLDVEWLRQAELVKKYGVHQANTRKEMDEMKETLEAVKAKLDMRIRSEPEAFGLPKVTEGAIQSTIILQEEYKEAMAEYSEAKYENDVALSVVEAFRHKKSALENLVQLLQSSYFAGPKSPRDLSYEALQKTERKEVNKKVKINRKTDSSNE